MSIQIHRKPKSIFTFTCDSINIHPLQLLIQLVLT